MKYFRLFILFVFGVITSVVSAANTAEDDSSFVDLVVNVSDGQMDTSVMQTVRLHYRVSQTSIERDYMNNAQVFEALDRVFVDRKVTDIAYIVILGSASPEGSSRNNDRLAEQRAASLKKYIITNYPGLCDEQIVVIPRGENWDGLESLIEKDKNVPYRAELLRILRSGLAREEQKRQIAAVGGGRPYKYLQQHIMPQLRGGISSMIYFRDRPMAAPDTVKIVRVDTVLVEKKIYVQHESELSQGSSATPGTPGSSASPLPRSKEKKTFYIAIKNNLLYDAALLPNLSVEMPFGREYKWSAAIEGDWSWWNSGASKYNYHRIQMAGVEVRRWFWNRSKNPLNGWYAGLYGYGGDYDIRLFAKKNSDVGQQSLLSYSAGLTFGYAMPIGRRLNLEFGAGIGYFGGEYKKYDVNDCREGVFPVLGIYRRNYFGLTKASVSLVWHIGSGVNVNNRKGVARW